MDSAPAFRFDFTSPTNPFINHRCSVISRSYFDADGTLFDFDRAEVAGEGVRPVLVTLSDVASTGLSLCQLRFISGDSGFP